jgi:hypothetical protein
MRRGRNARVWRTAAKVNRSGLVGIPTDVRGGPARRLYETHSQDHHRTEPLHENEAIENVANHNNNTPLLAAFERTEKMPSHIRRLHTEQQHGTTTTTRRWLALAALVISYNLAIVNGASLLPSSSLRRTTTIVVDTNETLTELEQRDELLDPIDDAAPTTTTLSSTAEPTTTSLPPGGEATASFPPPPGRTSQKEQQQVSSKGKEAVPAVKQPLQQQQQQQQHPPRQHPSSVVDSNNSTSAAIRAEQFLDDNDDGLYQRPNDSMFRTKSPSGSYWVPWVAVMGLVGMVFTAWQMADYPDGLFAGLCRLIFGSIRSLMYILTTPCRCCGGCSRTGVGGHEPYGRIATMEYGYNSGKNGTNLALELS